MHQTAPSVCDSQKQACHTVSITFLWNSRVLHALQLTVDQSHRKRQQTHSEIVLCLLRVKSDSCMCRVVVPPTNHDMFCCWSATQRIGQARGALTLPLISDVSGSACLCLSCVEPYDMGFRCHWVLHLDMLSSLQPRRVQAMSPVVTRMTCASHCRGTLWLTSRPGTMVSRRGL